MSLLVRISIIVSLMFSGFAFTGCTSGEEDTSVLESELENLDNDEEEELSEELGEEGDLADIEDDELKDELDDDDELDEFGEDEKDEFADEDSDDDFDKAFDEDDEQALAKELGEGSQDYPQGQDDQPSFPEEVIGDNNQQNQQQVPVDPVPQDPQQGQFITSETKELDVSDIPDPQIPQDDLGKADPLIPEEEEMNKNQNWVPVVKIKADPFFRNERLMNTVYLSRPNDTLSSVSNKIFGTDRTKELIDNNPHLAKGMDPGDKIYYTSPNRSEDKSSLKVYYDDIGLQSQKYVTSAGDNMRRLGSKLLGFPDGWKEVWAINPNIDSKTVLPAGTEIRYWTGEEQPVQVQAMAEEVPPEDPSTQMGAVEEPEAPVEPPPVAPTPVVADAQLPEEPPLPEATISEDEAVDPAMLSDADIEPLPEDDLSELPEEDIAAAGETSGGSSLVFTGALALLILGGAALVAIQIKNRKAQTEVTPPSLEYTQV